MKRRNLFKLLGVLVASPIAAIPQFTKSGTISFKSRFFHNGSSLQFINRKLQ